MRSSKKTPGLKLARITFLTFGSLSQEKTCCKGTFRFLKAINGVSMPEQSVPTNMFWRWLVVANVLPCGLPTWLYLTMSQKHLRAVPANVSAKQGTVSAKECVERKPVQQPN